MTEAERAWRAGHDELALALAGSVAADAPLADRRTQSAALTLRGRVLAGVGRSREAAEALDAALAMLTGTPHAEELIEILVAQGELQWSQGLAAEARRSLEEAASWSATLPARPGASRVERALGLLGRLQDRPEEALARYARAKSACVADPAEPCVALAELGTGFTHASTGDALAARQAFASAWAGLEGSGRARDEAEALRGLALASLALGDGPQADAMASRALALAERSAHRGLVAELAMLQGEIALARQDSEGALAHVEKAHEHFVALGSVTGVASSRIALGRLALARGHAAEARVHLSAAWSVFAPLEAGDAIATTATLLADVAALEADPLAEARWLSEALSRSPIPARALALWRRLAALALAAGDLASGTAHLARAALASERLAPGVGAGDRRAVYDALLHALTREPSTAEHATAALEVAERSSARAFTDVLARARSRRERPGAAALARRLEELDRIEHAALSAEPTSPPRTVQELQAVARERERVREALLGLAPKWLGPTGRDASSRIRHALGAVRAALRDEVAVVVYHLADPESFAFVVTRATVRVYRLAGRGVLAARASRFAETLARPAAGPSDRAEQRTIAQHLYEDLLAPLAGALATQRRLVIVPDRELNVVPFDALVVPAGHMTQAERSEASRRGIPYYLIFRHTISYAPSLAALDGLHAEGRRRAETPRHPFLAFADPHFGPRPLPRLEQTRTEALRASSHLRAAASPGTLYLGLDATEARLKALALSRYRVVHLATHGYTPDPAAGREPPALVLGASEGEDGVLHLEEVVDLRLDADLVVLSACATGRSALEPADGLQSLTQGFLYAGSSAVLATLWEVEDRHAADFMDDFYRALGAGRASAEAVRDARIAMITRPRPAASGAVRGIGGIVAPSDAVRPPGPPSPGVRASRSADPFFWASYVLNGESGDLLD